MTLKNGSKGNAVSELQQALNNLLNLSLTVDGKFGPATQKAVRAAQTKLGLKADGIAGPVTLGALGITSSTVTLKCEDLKQFDSRWANKIYGSNNTYSTFKSGGCGCLSATIIARALGCRPAGESQADSVAAVAQVAIDKGYRIKGSGTTAGIFGSALGLKRTACNCSSAEAAIRAGKFVAVCVRAGWSSYTGSGHWVVLYGVDGDCFLVRDVGSSSASRQKVKMADWKYVKSAYIVEAI
ncbi:MAG: peptidoglycan-binding protein [Paludibacteraceae bacterium]|nr:peptidoglycan-binding protein [Paludibacteraceae bacterium]